MWCNGKDTWDWEEEASDEELLYLHGKCDTWVLENYKEGDIAIIWNTFDDDLGKVVLIHCYIKRGNKYLDVRGDTENEDLIEEGFEDFYISDVGKLYCSSLEEYKSWLEKILNSPTI